MEYMALQVDNAILTGLIKVLVTACAVEFQQ